MGTSTILTAQGKVKANVDLYSALSWTHL